MICPLCKTELKCQESRKIDSHTRIREYGCAKCDKVFMSMEEMDIDAVDRAMQTLQRKYLLEKLERGQHG